MKSAEDQLLATARSTRKPVTGRRQRLSRDSRHPEPSSQTSVALGHQITQWSEINPAEEIDGDAMRFRTLRAKDTGRITCVLGKIDGAQPVTGSRIDD